MFESYAITHGERPSAGLSSCGESTVDFSTPNEFLPHSQAFLSSVVRFLLRKSQFASAIATISGVSALALEAVLISHALYNGIPSLQRFVVLTGLSVIPAALTYILSSWAQVNTLQELRYYQIQLHELELSKIVLREAAQSGDAAALPEALAIVGKRRTASVPAVGAAQPRNVGKITWLPVSFR
jgi:hypothetical protein